MTRRLIVRADPESVSRGGETVWSSCLNTMCHKMQVVAVSALSVGPTPFLIRKVIEPADTFNPGTLLRSRHCAAVAEHPVAITRKTGLGAVADESAKENRSVWVCAAATARKPWRSPTGQGS